MKSGMKSVLHHQVANPPAASPPGRILDDPPVVDVLEAVAGHLLLVAAAAVVGVADGVDVAVRVKPAGTRRVAQGDTRAVRHL